MPPFICASSVYLQPSAVPGPHQDALHLVGIAGGSSRLRQFPRRALFLVSLTALRSARCSVAWLSLESDVFLTIWLKLLSLEGEDHSAKCHSHRSSGQHASTWHCCDIISWLRKRLWCFCFLFLSFPFPSISFCLPLPISVSLTFPSTSLLPALAMESAFLQEALAPYIGESCQETRLVPQVCPVQLWHPCCLALAADRVRNYMCAY